MAELLPQKKQDETVSAEAARAVLDSPDFHRLIRRRWVLNLVLLAALFVIYYGFILLIAVDKPLMAQKIGAVTTLGIPVGVAVIVVGWLLTAIYVVWANGTWDPAVERLKKLLDRAAK